MINKIKSARKLFAIVCTAITVVACGGGDAGDFPSGIQNFTVTPSGQADVASGVRLSIKAYGETYGPTITSMTWSAQPLADATGTVEIFDPSCANANIKTRKVQNREDIVSVWECSTTVQGIEGARGPFNVEVTITTDSGAQQTEGFTLNVR